MSNFELCYLPDLAGLKLIRTPEELGAFLGSLRETLYPRHAVAMLELPEQLAAWTEFDREHENIETLFAVRSDPNGPHNNNWGSQELIRVVIIRLKTGKIHVFKNSIREFSN